MQERITVDGAEGDDHIAIMDTARSVSTNVFGGLGSDTIEIAPSEAPWVVANTLMGHSGVINHKVTQGTGADADVYDGLLAQGVSSSIQDNEQPSIAISYNGRDGSATLVSEKTNSGAVKFRHVFVL